MPWNPSDDKRLTGTYFPALLIIAKSHGQLVVQLASFVRRVDAALLVRLHLLLRQFDDLRDGD